MKILILDRDTDYSKRLQHYLSSKYTQLDVAVCDNLNSAEQSITREQFDVILFDSCFDEVDIEKMVSLRAAFAFISETNEVIKETETIMKYITVSEMYGKLCKLYGDKRGDRVVKKTTVQENVNHKSEIISFFPANGGAGSSTLAAALSISLAQDFEVLYINLEQRPSDDAFFSGKNKRGISEIVSILKTQYTDSSLIETINNSIQKDTLRTDIKLSYIKGFSNIVDCLSMTAQGVETFLKTVRDKLNYRYIVIDTDFVICPVLNSIISGSDKMVFVASGADVANSKLSKIQRYLEILGRNEDINIPNSYLLFNQYYGIKDEKSISRNMTVVGRICRYRTDDGTRITSQKVIDEILSKKGIFNELLSSQETASIK